MTPEQEILASVRDAADLEPPPGVAEWMAQQSAVRQGTATATQSPARAGGTLVEYDLNDLIPKEG